MIVSVTLAMQITQEISTIQKTQYLGRLRSSMNTMHNKYVTQSIAFIVVEVYASVNRYINGVQISGMVKIRFLHGSSISHLPVK